MNTAIEMKPIDDLKKIDDHTNTAKVLAMLKAYDVRLARLEQAVFNEDPLKKYKELTRIGKYEPYILEALVDGKIHSSHGLLEEIRVRHPELPEMKVLALNHALNIMSKRDRIVKIARNIYRKKEA